MAYLNGEKITLNPKFLGLSNLKPLYDILGLEPTISGDVVTVEELTALVEGINALGVANLKKKLTDVADEVTTVEIMSLIDSIIEIPLTLDHTVKFMVDGEAYEVVSVKAGNSINAPTTKPDRLFLHWEDTESNQVVFPFTPLTDMTMISVLAENFSDRYYSHFRVDINEYPYLFIRAYYESSRFTVNIHFAKQWWRNSSNTIIYVSTDSLYCSKTGYFYYTDSEGEKVYYPETAEGFFEFTKNNTSSDNLGSVTNESVSYYKEDFGYLFTNTETLLQGNKYGQIIMI